MLPFRSSGTRRAPTTVVVCLALAFALVMTPRAEGASGYRIITSPDNPTAELSRGQAADMFLKHVTTWPDGERVIPVDLPAASPVRAAFSEGVLERSVVAQKSYWQQQIFSGRGVPPVELDSEEAVVRFVVSHPGAIGYVSDRAELEGAKVLSLR